MYLYTLFKRSKLKKYYFIFKEPIEWTNEDLPYKEIEEPTFETKGLEGIKSEAELFKKMFSKEAFTLITVETNR